MAEKKKNNKKKIILIIGLVILGIGVLSGAGALFAGLITLARDLIFTAAALDMVIVGGVLGKKAIDGIISSISKKKNKKLQKELSKEKEKTPQLEAQSEKKIEENYGINPIPTPTSETKKVEENKAKEEFNFEPEQKEEKNAEIKDPKSKTARR